MRIYYFLIVYFLKLVHIGFGESNLDCLKAENCSSCIQIQHNCAWCLDERFDPKTGKKCDYETELIKDGCPSDRIYNPKNTVEEFDQSDSEMIYSNDVSYKPKFTDIIDNQNRVLSRSNRNQLKASAKSKFKRQNLNQNDKLVQLKPDKIKLKIRPNSKIRFNLTFEQAEKYPLDVYYLMDLTYSMKDHLSALVKLADKINDSMANITTRFRLGFGSFVDKVVMPYSNMLPQKLNNPCNQNIPCIRAYGYRNHLSLTNDSLLFLNKVKEAKLSGNLDNAEGGFDALVQVITCKKEISWKKRSRKIILFATDSLFHYAGDGKLGGIVKPNDGQCHLDKDGYYTETVNQDYPSIEQINKILVNNQINIIFAVPKSASSIYEILSENLEGSVIGELAEDSSNIVDLIKENYKKIVSTIELKDDSSKNVNVKYYSRCTSDNKSLSETNLCQDVGVGQKLQFEIELEVKSCKEFKNKIENFVIFPLGIEEKTEIELELVCDCECDAKLDLKSEYCNRNGNLKCGICECDNAEYYGNKCECSQNNQTSAINLQFGDECIKNGQTCSNKGVCMCGVCLCEDKSADGLLIYGKHCECDNYSCSKDNDGVTCGGKGQCCNQKCECNDGWTGESCDCSLDETNCLSPINNKVCSGNGRCVCGKCQCERKQNGDIYTGRYCENCPTCNDECAAYDPCVLCKAFNVGPYKSNCKENCNFDMKIVKKFSYLTNNQNETNDRTDSNQFDALIKRCVMIDEDNCKYEFIYTFQPNIERIYVEILEEKLCPNAENIFYFVFFIILFIILVGLLALITWRAIVSYKDNQDYKKWIESLKKRQFTSQGLNPLYVEPQTTYKNPLYSKVQK